MCGRFTLHTEKEILSRRFEFALEDLAELVPRYNIAPTQSILTLHGGAGSRQAEMMHWGLVPGWTRDRAKLPKMINARVETVASKPSYRESFRHRRCLILADGFYEWQAWPAPLRGKTPHWISLSSGEPFSMAGLWAEWRPPGEIASEPLHSCTIITAPARAAIQAIHHRMPVILRPEDEAAWLDPELDDRPEALHELLGCIPAEGLQPRPVSKLVNSPRNDSAELIRPSDPPELGFT